MRLIDERELVRRIAEIPDLRTLSTATVGKCIKECRTIDAEPVRHGRWIKVAAFSDGVLNTAKCSLCNTNQAISNWDYYSYCMFCGAKMDKEEDDD